MKTVELKNTFHNTTVRVRTDAASPADAWLEIQCAAFGQARPTPAARARYRRVWGALCGVEGCACGVFRPS